MHLELLTVPKTVLKIKKKNNEKTKKGSTDWSGDLCVYLEPFVIGEEAKWHQRIAHEEPVDKLLNYIDEGVEMAVDQLCQQRTVPDQSLDLSHKHTHRIHKW